MSTPDLTRFNVPQGGLTPQMLDAAIIQFSTMIDILPLSPETKETGQKFIALLEADITKMKGGKKDGNAAASTT
jgi:hypothetical protein